MKRIIVFGVIAAFFFSSTFAINRWLNVQEGGHWFWTASLRYLYVFFLLSILVVVFYGVNKYTQTLKCFFKYWYFWVFSGGIGFGAFYLLLCYAASYSAGWVLATTWQITILMTPVIIFILGNKVSLKGIIFLIIMFSGILLVNYEEFKSIALIDLKSILPITVAAFCYPLGNTLCKYGCEGRYKRMPIHDFEISQNIFSQILLMAMGSLPILIVVGVLVSPDNPTYSQVYCTAIVALLTGVIATSCLYKARQLSRDNPFALSAADGTQAFEAPLALFWEWLLFNGVLPSFIGYIGLSLVIIGIVLFYRTNIDLSNG